MTSLFSREALFLLNNLLFVGFFVVCFWGVIFPVVTDALGIVGQAIPALAGIFTGQKADVRTSYYTIPTAVLSACLIFLMGIAPESAWKYSTYKTIFNSARKPFAVSLVIIPVLLLAGMRSWVGILGYWICAFTLAVTVNEFWKAAWARHNAQQQNLLTAFWQMVGKNQRRYGGYIIHIGIVLMALGIIGSKVFQTETQQTIPQGSEISLGRYTISFDSLSDFNTTDGRNVARAVLSVFKDGKYVGELHPRRDYYYESQQAVTIAGVRSTLADDLYIILADWQPLSTKAATFKVYHNPLINWLWLGSLVFVLGTVVAAWPDKETEKVVVRKTVPTVSNV